MEIQLFLSISILPSIALKHLNFPDNFDFSGIIAAMIMGKISHKKSISLNIK